MFDERNPGLGRRAVPFMELAEQTGLSELIDTHTQLPAAGSSRTRSTRRKLSTIIAAMMTGADTIGDVNLLLAGGTPRVFGEVYAPSTTGIYLREFAFGHSNQFAAVPTGDT
ncbi:MAG TPA: hypothetical protein VIW24_08530 [Aldersonia sp.]